MAEYFIDTAGGPRGPYTEETIIEGVKSGKIPTGARVRNAATNETMRAVDLTGQQPEDSGSYAPPAEYRAEGQHRQQYQQQRPMSGPQPAQNYYQQPQYQHLPQQTPQYPQHQYPPQQYPQQNHGYPQRPYGNQMPYGQQYPYPVARQTSGLAIASLAVSCASVVICPLISIVGIILGVIALKECEPHGQKVGRGMALAGIWVGVGLTVLTLAFIGLIIAADSM